VRQRGIRCVNDLAFKFGWLVGEMPETEISEISASSWEPEVDEGNGCSGTMSCQEAYLYSFKALSPFSLMFVWAFMMMGRLLRITRAHRPGAEHTA